MSTRADVSVLLVNFNTAHLLDECIGRLRVACQGSSAEIIIVDNQSTDGSQQVLAERFGDCRVILNQHNPGFGRANNQALEHATGRFVLLLNTDAFVEPDALKLTLAYMASHPRCGVLGVHLVGRDGEMQPSCRYFPTPLNQFLKRTGLSRLFPFVRLVDDFSWDHASVRECDWVPGCYYLIRREAIDAAGLFDPRYFLYCEEVDHCRAVKAAGYSVVYFPGTTVVHIGGESAKSVSELTGGRQISNLQIESQLLYFRKHHGLAGVAAAVFFEALTSAVLAAKWVIRRLRWKGAGTFFAPLGATWRLLWATGWGTRPTR